MQSGKIKIIIKKESILEYISPERWIVWSEPLQKAGRVGPAKRSEIFRPGSLILSGVMMFDHLGWTEVARSIIRATEKTIADKGVTYDLARQMEGAKKVKCPEFASAIIKNL